MKKRIVSLLLAVCLVLGLVPMWQVNANAESKLFAGEGTEESPYLIESAEDLGKIAVHVADVDLKNAYYEQINDIDLSDYDSWIPIGTEENPFYGYYNGNGKAITGLHITNGELTHVGLFGCVNFRSELTNITIANAEINLVYTASYTEDTINVGILAGAVQGDSMTGGYGNTGKCSVSGNVTVNTVAATTCNDLRVGGCIGVIDTSGTFNDFEFSGNVEVVAGSYTRVGGVVGLLSNGRLVNAEATGAVIVSSEKGDAEGGGVVGGAQFGGISGGSRADEKWIHRGDVEVTSKDKGAYAGGILGRDRNGYINVQRSNINSSACGSVFADSESSEARAGGLVGIGGNGFTIENGNAQGTRIEATSKNGNARAGGILSFCSNGTVIACKSSFYYIIGESNAGRIVSRKGTKQTLAENYAWSECVVGADLLQAQIIADGTQENKDGENTADYGCNLFNQETKNEQIVQAVMAYTSDGVYAQFKEIMDDEMTNETRLYRLTELFGKNYGITDPREGIAYLSNTTDKRQAYLGLTSNDLYCASNFEYWLNNTGKGAVARVTLLADGLVFNNEINAYLDFTTLASGSYPGVEKYKNMLYDFMDTMSEEIEIMDTIKLVSDLSKNVTDSAKIHAEYVIDLLNDCTTRAQRKEIIEYCKSNGIFTELVEQKKSGTVKYDKDGKVLVQYELDESSGFGKFAKRIGRLTKTVSVTDMVVEDVIELMELDSKLNVYTQFNQFLTDITTNTNLPYQLRGAAWFILQEIEEGYLGSIKDIAIDILDKTKFNDTIENEILERLGISGISDWLDTIEIAAFFVNQITDIGHLVKKEAEVEGYAYLANAFVAQLEASKKRFVENKTENNAWDFYYNYMILWMLRYKGEEAYLAMSKVKGIAALFSDFGYAEKAEVVNDTIAMVKNQFVFTMDEETNIPESVQYLKKYVVNCPVDVEVLLSDGTLIATLIDGEESDLSNEYGRFIVTKQTYTGEYAKVICLNTPDVLTIRIRANSDGLVDCFAVDSNNPSCIYAVDKLRLTCGESIVLLSDLDEDSQYEVQGTNDECIRRGHFVATDAYEYIALAEIQLDSDIMEMSPGETRVVGVKIVPYNTTDTTIKWQSSDESIATVKNGVITAVSEGEATIYAIPTDNADVQATIKILVSHIHTVVISKKVNPTCTEDGYSGDEVCTICGETIKTGETTVKLGHKYENGKVTREATCEQDGVKTYTCGTCGETKTEKIAATGHDYQSVVTKPTCTAKGYTTHTCKNCGDSYKDTYTNASGHSWNAGEVTTAATCEKDGVKTYTCATCGKTETEAIKATGHSYESKVVKATCTEKGYTLHTCKTCGDSYKDTYTNATGHSWDSGKVTTKAACTTTGVKTYTCTSCDKTKTETIAATGHSYETKVVKATCTEKGYTLRTCKTCGNSYKDTYTNATGHSWNSGKVTTEATCERDGVKTYTCQTCGGAKTEKIAATGHDYKTEVVAPSCTEKGYTLHICKNCGNSYKDNYTAETGHDYESVLTQPTCTEKGYTTHTCKNCGDSYQDTYTDVTGHNWDKGTVTKAPTGSETGVKTYTCKTCGETKTEDIAKLSNPFTDLANPSSYYDAVLWAVDKGITKGTSDTEFSPKADCTRAQIVTFLWRYAGEPEPTTTEHNFVDLVEDSSYYKAVLWAVEKGITKGLDETHFGPKEPCTRAQIVTFLWRAAEEPEPTSQQHSFEDIVEGSSYYNAVLWAVEKGITTGADATHFDPKETCTRAQGMTFLYRYNNTK